MFKKGLFVVATLCVVGTFVACERQNSEAAVSDSVAEASEKQLSPESSTTSTTESTTTSTTTPAPAAEAPAAPADASTVPSIEEKKVAPAQ